MTQQPPYRGSTCTRRRSLQGALGGAAGLTLWPWRAAHATAQPSGQLTVGVETWPGHALRQRGNNRILF